MAFEACLFEGQIPVRLKQNDLDERNAELTLRISNESPTANSSHKVLRCQLTDESDPFFLFTLDVSEEDFAQVKLDQRLLIDFAAFPGKLVELLEHCREASKQESARFIATLVATNGGGMFSVVETNNFRQLYHISLQLRAGNDVAIKRYLAAKLKDFKARNSGLDSELMTTRALLEQKTEESTAANAEIRSLQDQQQRTIADIEHRANSGVTAEREKSLEVQRELQDRADTGALPRYLLHTHARTHAHTHAHTEPVSRSCCCCWRCLVAREDSRRGHQPFLL